MTGGVLNITGFPVTVPAPNGQGTVVANGNALAGLRIFESPANARSAPSTAWSRGRTRSTAFASTAAAK